MKVTMSKIQERDLQVFMTCETTHQADEYEPIAIDMSDVIKITCPRAYVILPDDTPATPPRELVATEMETVHKASTIQLQCNLLMASTGEDVCVSVFLPPKTLEDTLNVIMEDVDEFAVMKFFWDIANGNTRSPYTEAMMGSNK